MLRLKAVARGFAVTCLGTLALVAGAKPKKADLPAIFKNAQFVYVEAYNGDEFNPRVVPDDRNAIYNVEQSLKEWKRYSVALQRDQAELVFRVRKGRIASVTPRVEVGIGRPTQSRQPSDQDRLDPTRNEIPPGVSVGVDAETGPPNDILEVYLVSYQGGLTGPIWSHTLKDGLNPPTLPLFQKIKREIDTAYPK